MANNIELFKQYIDLLDEVYKMGSVTQVLDGNNELAREGQNAGEMVIPMMTMDGLGDYDRNGGGYAKGSVTLSYETKKCNYDRGRRFDVNDMDNVETAGIAFGQLASQFIRTKVVPEVDAVRFASYVKQAKNHTDETLADGDAWIKSLGNATIALDNAEVPMEDRFLFLTSEGITTINSLDTTKSRAVLDRFAGVAMVPATRFYTAIDLLDGKQSNELSGGYKKATDGKELNYVVVSRSALIQYFKNIVNKVIDPQSNQEDDAWRFFFHAYGINDAYDNKKDGIYYSAKV